MTNLLQFTSRRKTSSVGRVNDWNPRDPEAATTRFDLTEWSVDERADVVAKLAADNIQHGWDGDELLVPQSDEEVVEDILDELEDLFDNDVESETAEFDIEDWSEEERAKLCNMLDNLDIGYRLEDGVLIAPIGAEQVIESCIDSIEEDLDGDDA
ncbi:MAG: hypothetical protein RLZZ16_1163 [Actinomycetota bacterium]|jgi:hypothetical protein